MKIPEKLATQSNEEYFINMCQNRHTLCLSWQDVADVMNELNNVCLHKDAYRKRFNKYLELDDGLSLDEVKLEKYKLNDQRTQVNALYRRISREETLIEIARDCVSHLDETFKLNPPNPIEDVDLSVMYEAILEISDWHYGIEVENSWNVYNPDLARTRIEKLRDSVIEYIKFHGIRHLHIVNLGDMIAGRIHLPLRINSRYDVITQTIHVSELIAEFINDLSNYVYIDYYDTLDNHSRLEPNLKESIDLESLARITTWFLSYRLENNRNVKLNTNSISDDIITFEVRGFKIAGVHGHKDKPQKVVSNLSLMTQTHYDLILTAHYHHFYADEQNMTVLIANGSMMGTDDYAEKLRLTSYPTQNLILVSDNNPCAGLYRITL